jgi:hypothetical protein
VVFYTFVIHPDVFIMFLVASCLYLALMPYAATRAGGGQRIVSMRRAIGLGAAGGFMVAAKAPLAIFFLPMLAMWLVRGTRRGAFVAAGIAIVTAMSFSMVHLLEDGSLTAYQGKRLVVSGADPFSPGFPETGLSPADTSAFFSPARVVSHVKQNVARLSGYCPSLLLHYVAGRRIGMFPYMAPFLALLALGIAGLRKREGRAALWVLCPLALYVLLQFFLTPLAYHGGATALGNRYAVEIAPAFFFCCGWAPVSIRVLRPVTAALLASVLFFPGPALLSPATALRDNYLVFQWERFRFLPVEPELLWLGCDRPDSIIDLDLKTKAFRLSEPGPAATGPRFWMANGEVVRLGIERLGEPGAPIRVRLASANCCVSGYVRSGFHKTPFTVNPGSTVVLAPAMEEARIIRFGRQSLYYWPMSIVVSGVAGEMPDPGIPDGVALHVGLAQPDPDYPAQAPDGSFEINPADSRADSLLLWGWWETEPNMTRWAGDSLSSAIALPASRLHRQPRFVQAIGNTPTSPTLVRVTWDKSPGNTFVLEPSTTTATVELSPPLAEPDADLLVRLDHDQAIVPRQVLGDRQADSRKLTALYRTLAFFSADESTSHSVDSAASADQP